VGVIAAASKIDTPLAPPSSAIATVCENSRSLSGPTNNPL
jgi:hypothetical protein